MNIVDNYYKYFGADIKYVNNMEAEHGFPTDDPDLKNTEHQCGYFGKPFINYCNYDGVGEMFKHIMPYQDSHPLKPKIQTWKEAGKLEFFKQAEFFKSNDDFKESQLADNGYVYIPNSCYDKETFCRVHLALHGCW